MLKRYSVEYSLQLRQHVQPDRHTFYTDDPLTCESFVQELLEKGMAIHAIRHDAVELPRVEADRIIRLAAAGIASRLICASLHIKPDEERYRFGFAA